MSSESEILAEAERQMLGGVPHAEALGFTFVSAEIGKASLRAPWREDLVGDPLTGALAGGVVTALLDHVCGYSVRSVMTTPFSTATLDLRIDYMRAAAAKADVTATAHCYKVTRSIAFVRAHAFDADPEDPIATAQAAFILNRPDPA